MLSESAFQDSRPVFLVARQFVDQQQSRVYRAFAENGLAMRRTISELARRVPGKAYEHPLLSRSNATL